MDGWRVERYIYRTTDRRDTESERETERREGPGEGGEMGRLQMQ